MGSDDDRLAATQNENAESETDNITRTNNKRIRNTTKIEPHNKKNAIASVIVAAPLASKPNNRVCDLGSKFVYLNNHQE